MSLKFYYAPMSTASVTALVLEELEVPHERILVTVGEGTRKPEFLKINPNGKVPVIEHDGTVIFESSAITMYLGEVYGVDKKLYPASGPSRGEAMMWIGWANVTLGEAAGRWLRNTNDNVPEDLRNAKVGQAAREDIDNCLRILDGALASRAYLVGDFTLADAHIRAFVDWLEFTGIDMAPFKNLRAWADRCAQRPAFQRLRARES